MIYSLEYKDKNIITFPKCGCTSIIKICTNNENFKNHMHSFEHNKCLINQNIHTCGFVNSYEGNELEKIVFFRYAHERIESFYFSNYLENKNTINNKLTFEEFVNGFLNDELNYIPGLKGHIFNLLNFKDKIENSIFVHLDDLNYFFKTNFNEDISKNFIINKSIYKKEMYNEELFKKVKEKFITEYEFLEKKIKNK